MLPGTFENGDVAKVAKRNHVAFALTVIFSYSVNGETHSGEYTEDFRAEWEAQQILRSLINGPLHVRYDPKKPSDNFLDPYRDVRP
jgi:hypothetical protein